MTGSASRVSRGFHRLGLLLAAIPLVVGVCFIGYLVWDTFWSARDTYDKMAAEACAKAKFATMRNLPPPQQDLTDQLPPYAKSLSDYLISYDLKELGCSDVYRLVSKSEIMTASDEGHVGSFWDYYASSLPQLVSWVFLRAFAVSVAVYGVVRAIGWVALLVRGKPRARPGRREGNSFSVEPLDCHDQRE